MDPTPAPVQLHPYQTKITGYRALTQGEIDLINNLKELGETIGAKIAELEKNPDTDKRWVAIAKTDFQKAIMFAIRCVAKPTSF